MILPRAVTGPIRAMARPSRPSSERAAVAALAGTLPALSRRSAAAVIARRVIAAVMQGTDADPSDGMATALADIAAAIDAPAVHLLATCPDIDTQALVRATRLAAFEARGCRHLPEAEWPAERAAVAAAAVSVLTSRYARHLRNRA